MTKNFSGETISQLEKRFAEISAVEQSSQAGGSGGSDDGEERKPWATKEDDRQYRTKPRGAMLD
jgi:hypothetical protein